MIYLVTKDVELFQDNPNYKYITVKESLKMLETLFYIGVDTETEGLDVYTKKLLLVQLGCYDFQIVIDCKTIDINLYKELLESNRKFIFWNAKFDLKFFFHKRINITNIIDGYLQEKLLYLGYPPGVHSMSLKAATEHYCSKILDKEVRSKINDNSRLNDSVIVYAANDVKYLENIIFKQNILLEKYDLVKAADIENKFVFTLAYIEYSGILLDINKWSEKIKIDNQLFEDAKNKLDNWVIENFSNTKFCYTELQGDLFTGFNSEPQCAINWASTKQVIPLFEILGFNLIVKDKDTGKLKKSVSSKVIEMQLKVSPIAKLYINYKQQEKIISTYGQNWLDQINPVSGRIHTNFNQLMNTSRLSSGGKDKFNKIEYVNIQNLPNNDITRHAFIPQKGYTLIDCDYTAQEDLIFTELSQEKKLIDFYNDSSGRDGHSMVAKICFPDQLKNVPEIDVKSKYSKLRSISKKAKFSIHYGGNGTTIARNLGLPIEEGLRIEKAYLSGFSNINKFFKEAKANMWKRGYILINKATGHKRFIYNYDKFKKEEKSHTKEFWNEYRMIKAEYGDHPILRSIKKFFKTKGMHERNALNGPVQGTAAIITKIAGIRYMKHLLKEDLLYKVWIPNCVHDEYLIEVPDELVEQESKELQDAMEKAGSFFVKSVKLKAVPEHAKYWVH